MENRWKIMHRDVVQTRSAVQELMGMIKRIAATNRLTAKEEGKGKQGREGMSVPMKSQNDAPRNQTTSPIMSKLS